MPANPLWDYSLLVYDWPGVKPLLLGLQDRVGADVNLLLLCAWLASERRSLSASQLADLGARAQQWREGCIEPVRAARRFLADSDDPEQQACYQALKQAELMAERLQQARLYRALPALTTESAAPGTLALRQWRHYFSSDRFSGDGFSGDGLNGSREPGAWGQVEQDCHQLAQALQLGGRG